MKVQYSIRSLANDRYVLEFELPTMDGEPVKALTTTCTGADTLKKLLSRTNQSVAVAANYYRARNDKIYSAGAFQYKWDGDSTNIPDIFKKDAEVYRYMNGLTSATLVSDPAPIVKTKPVKKETDKRLYEVVKQNDVWTIKKHETELLTWEEAATELAKRI